MGYTDANVTLGADAKYNGNIAWVEWRTGANCTVGGVSRNKAGYGFTYDGLDRMTGSKYGENTGSWTNLDRYNENLTYDANGNILTLVRKGYISAGNWNTIDNLTYTYGNSTNPNWATTIADGSGSALGYPNASGTFSFDAAGNQTTYSAKGITAITYNHLNLPTKYTWSGSNLEIQYDAAGRKLKKIPSTGNAKTYIGGIEYSATAIEAIYHPEGRARLISSTWEYEYGIKDHLGNPRVYFKYNGSISFLQENHYYPFGMEQGGWSAPPSPENKYKYNGKEYNDDFALGLYDYGARWYDPVVGRWGQVDPSAEKMNDWSPYNYGFNDPIKMIDPDGRSPIKGLKALYNVGKKVYQGYKSTGKLNVGTIGKALKGEALDIIDNVRTLTDKKSSTFDKVLAVVDLATGFGSEAKKLTNALGVVDDVGGVKKTGKKASNINPEEAHHTTFERDKNGDIYKYETYEKTTSGHDNPILRFDGGKPDGSPGAPHTNKITKEDIPTPHVQGKAVEGGVRAAEPSDLPNNKRFKNQ